MPVTHPIPSEGDEHWTPEFTLWAGDIEKDLNERLSDDTLKATIVSIVGAVFRDTQEEAEAAAALYGVAGYWFVELPPTEVTATAPTFTDPSGTASDVYIIPTTTGVDYKVGGVTKVAGSYTGTGTVTITAHATSGYLLTGTATWSHTFSTSVVIPSGAYDDAVLADSPLYYLGLGDAVGTTTVAKQGSGAATWAATAVTFGVAGIGDAATAADFDGTTSKITSSAALPAMPAGSVAILLDRDSSSASGFNGDLIGTTMANFALRIYAGKVIAGRSGAGGGSGFVYISYTILQDVRTLVEFTWDATSWVAYINGVQFATGADNFTGISSAVWTIGNVATFLDGQLAGVAIFTTKQTSARALARAVAAGLA